MRKWLTEFVGTLLFALVVTLVTRAGGPALVTSAKAMLDPVSILGPLVGPLAAGGILMVMVYMGGHISGGHYNPAVSLAALLARKLSVVDFVAYVISQVLGAIAGAGFAYLIIPGYTITITPPPGVDLERALLAEGVFTFALALVVLNVATSKRTAGNSYYGLAIGFTVLVGALAVGRVSGGVFNPAIATGPNVIHAADTDFNALRNLWWVYWVGPPIGAVLAALVFHFQEQAVPPPAAEKK